MRLFHSSPRHLRFHHIHSLLRHTRRYRSGRSRHHHRHHARRRIALLLYLAGFCKFPGSNACHTADKLIGSECRVCQQTGDEFTRRIEVTLRKEGTMLLGGGIGTVAHLVKRQQAIGYRVRCHSINAARNAHVLIGNAHGVELSRNLFGRQFLGKVFQTENIVFGIRFGQQAVQFQLTMDAQLHSRRFHGEGGTAQFGIGMGIVLHAGFLLTGNISKCIVVDFNLFHQVAVNATYTALKERRREIRLQSGIGTAFGNHTLTHVGNGVDIEVRQGTHQTIRPVVVAQCHLLLGRELQAAVCSEMYHSIGLETELCPEVRSDIGMGRCGIRSVHHLEGIIATSRRILGQQHHVAELQTRYTDRAVRRSHVFTGELAVGGHHLGIFLGAKRLPYPCLVFGLADQCRMSVLHELIEGALGIVAKNGTLRLNHAFQFFGRGREAFYRIALLLHVQQQVVKRWTYLHAGRRKRILSGTFVIVDGYTLLGIGLALQADVVVHRPDESLQAFGDGESVLQAFLILVVPEEDVGADGSVNLRRYDALRKETTAHAHLVVFPFLHQAVDVERGKQRNVLLGKIIYDIITHAPVRHIDDGSGLQGVDVVLVDKRFHVAHWIDHVTGFLQFRNQVGGFAHLSGDDDGRSTFTEEAVGPEEIVICRHRVEAELLFVGLRRVNMVHQVVAALHNRFGLIDGEEFAVDMPAHIVQQAAVVAASAIAQIST